MGETVYEWLGVPWTVDQKKLRQLHGQKLREYPHEQYPEEFMSIQERFRHVKDARARRDYDRMLFETDILSLPEEHNKLIEWKEEGKSEEALKLAERLIEVSGPYGIVWPTYIELFNDSAGIFDEEWDEVIERLFALDEWDEWHCRAVIEVWRSRTRFIGWETEDFERISNRLELEADKLDLEERHELCDYLVSKEKIVFFKGQSYQEACDLLEALQGMMTHTDIWFRWSQYSSNLFAYDEMIEEESEKYENARQVAVGLVDTVDQIAAAYEQTRGQEIIAEQLRKVASTLANQLRSIGYEEIDILGRPFDEDTMETHDALPVDEHSTVVSIKRRAFYDEEMYEVRKGHVITE